MDMLQQLNDAVGYVEECLCAEPDVDKAARIACVSADSFMRFFSYMTGMTLTEYIRRRRMTLAAQDIRYSQKPIIDIAVQYGYDSAAAFSRAFTKQHGITPSAFRKHGGSLKVYPPVSFHIRIKGASKMDFRIVETEAIQVYGIGRPYEGQGYKSREELRHTMWADRLDNIPERLCAGRFDEPENTAMDGVWYGIWQDGGYRIARTKECVKTTDLPRSMIPAGTYAAFTSERGGFAGEEIPKLFQQIFDSWLPTSAYTWRGDCIIEVLHLWTGRELRRENRYYEVWIPVELK